MSNKPMKSLDRSDLAIRRDTPVGMEDGIKQVIIRQVGFELYNTRPYHNYETWSDGYIVIGRRDGKAMTAEEAAKLLTDRRDRETYAISSREDLDDACAGFVLERGKSDD